MLGAGSALVEMALESLLRSDKQEKKSYVWLPITAKGPAPRGTGSKRRGEEVSPHPAFIRHPCASL